MILLPLCWVQKRSAIPIPEVHDLLGKIHNILDKAVSKLAWNAGCTSAFLFNSDSRQQHWVWALQYLFLNMIKGTVPSSETCLSGLMNGIWHRCSNSIYLAYHGLLALYEFVKLKCFLVQCPEATCFRFC